ncbi:hypothetical protein A4H97_10980 [Niastella yeongjuensis]|uniref:Uncharacterized protein n=2 Tax=Niastella yeongjuensis TaxID=354355 RepID=A0A1V9EFH7_9BACT|nr:hypothetical protein A4H97_10980 [Niastella yeongjuensis]
MTVPGQVTPQKPTPEELKREITNTQLDIERRKYVDFTEVYLKSFKQFLQLNPDSFSIAKAVYLSENPWYGASGKSYNNAQGGFNFSRGLILLTGLEEKRGSEKESNNKQKNP